MTDTTYTLLRSPERLVGTDTVTWAAMGASVDGAPYAYGKFPDKTVQVFGTFGGTVTLQGSNDPRVLSDPGNAVWFTLLDIDGDAITFTAAGARVIRENPRFIRPSNGSGITASTCIIHAVGE